MESSAQQQQQDATAQQEQKLAQLDINQQQDQQQHQDEEEDDGVDCLKQEENLTEEQEATLFAFLQKVSKACDEDSSVPDFVGLQVGDWLKELQDKNAAQPLPKDDQLLQ
eukprot:403367240